jgi:hypothetical protein
MFLKDFSGKLRGFKESSGKLEKARAFPRKHKKIIGNLMDFYGVIAVLE